MARLPAFFLCHGGGPWPYMDGPFRRHFDKLEASLSSIFRELDVVPKSVLVVSAHWETEAFSFSSNPKPGMYHDYSGFPEHTYRVRYGAPGEPILAQRAQALLLADGFEAHLDSSRGFDHGTFTLLQPMRPEADIPVVQMSIQRDFDADVHLKAGRSLAPLRDEGVLVIGSGMTYHNLRKLDRSGGPASHEFNAWLVAALDGVQAPVRDRSLRGWRDAPAATLAQPEPDHLLPLMVAAGAAGADVARLHFRQDDFFGHLAISSYRFG